MRINLYRNHLSSNLFFLYIFGRSFFFTFCTISPSLDDTHEIEILKYFFCSPSGKLVEEEEGNFALWTSYILTGAGANLVSWLVLPRNAVSVGASGAVFGLFAISVLVKVG